MTASHVIVRVVLVGVALVLTGTVVLVFDVVAGTGPAAAGVVSVVVLLALALLPIAVRAYDGPPRVRLSRDGRRQGVRGCGEEGMVRRKTAP